MPKDIQYIITCGVKPWKQSPCPSKWEQLSKFWYYTDLLEYYKCIASIYTEYEIVYYKYVSMLCEKFRLQTGLMMFFTCRRVCVLGGVYQPWSPDLLTHLGSTDRKPLATNSSERHWTSCLKLANRQAPLFWKLPCQRVGFWERGHTFHHGQQIRQTYRLSKKDNESILMSGLKVSPLSLARDFGPGSSKCPVRGCCGDSLVEDNLRPFQGVGGTELETGLRSRLSGRAGVLFNWDPAHFALKGSEFKMECN